MTTELAQSIAKTTRFMPNLANLLCDDIPEDKFASMFGTSINHPAFILGHISYYSAFCVGLLGGSPEFEDGEAELYQVGVDCKDGGAYPSKETLLKHFKDRCEFAASFIESCSEDTLSASANDTPFAERFDTLGQVASFMLTSHPSFHFGQLSGWRRIAGMGSAT